MNPRSSPIGRGITVTFKYGKGYDDTWAVFHGLPDEVREDIASYFRLDDDPNRLSLSDLVINATAAAHGVSTVASGLGATVVESTPQPSAPREASGDAWTQAATATAERDMPRDPLLDDIERAQSIDALKRLWAANRAAFTDPALMESWRARGRALSPSA